MGTKIFGTKSAIRIGDDWESFLNEHPELRVKKRDEKIVYVMLPEEADNFTLVILDGEVAYISYCYNDNLVTYTSPTAHESKIDLYIEECDKQFAVI